MKYNRFIKCALTKVRRGVSDIEVHTYKNRYIVDAICPSLCKGADEDEVHFILYCPAFDDLRQKFIPPQYYRYPKIFRLSMLLAAHNDNILTENLCMYVYRAERERETETETETETERQTDRDKQMSEESKHRNIKDNKSNNYPSDKRYYL